MSSSNCCFLICIQFSQEADQVVWYSHLFKNFPVCCSAHKGFSVVNEADVFLAFSWFFYDPTDVGNLISGSSGFSKSSLYIWKFSVHVLWKLSLENFEHYFASMWNKCNCVVVWVQLLPLAWSKSGQKKKGNVNLWFHCIPFLSVGIIAWKEIPELMLYIVIIIYHPYGFFKGHC